MSSDDQQQNTSSDAEPATESDKPSWKPGEPVIARAGQYYRNTRYLMAVVLLGMGLYFGYDGWFGWPNSNAGYDQLERQKVEARRRGDTLTEQKLLQEQAKFKRHSDTDIYFQKVLFCVLPPLAVLLLIYWLYSSRGEYRAEGTALEIPGHPTVPFENITEIDRRLWDRKGIAYISYDLGNGRQGRFKLDDFVYERWATDEIFKRVEEYVTPPAAEGTGETAAGDEDKAHG
jgi:hypothetical protein